MFQSKDRYPEIGPKVLIGKNLSIEDIVVFIRKYYPNAFAEGSTGNERTWYINGRATDKNFVAHTWTTRFGNTYARIK